MVNRKNVNKTLPDAVVDLRWVRSLTGYEWTTTEQGEQFLRPRGQSIFAAKSRNDLSDPFNPLRYDRLFRDFAGLDETPEDILEFTEEFGLIGGSVWREASTGLPWIEAVPFAAYVRAIRELRFACGLLDAIKSGKPALLDEWAVPSPQGLEGMAFVSPPSELYDAKTLGVFARPRKEQILTMHNFDDAELHGAGVAHVPVDADARFSEPADGGVVDAARLLLLETINNNVSRVALNVRFEHNRFRHSYVASSLYDGLWAQLAASTQREEQIHICPCGCGRPVRQTRGNRKYFDGGCRVRMSRTKATQPEE